MTPIEPASVKECLAAIARCDAILNRLAVCYASDPQGAEWRNADTKRLELIRWIKRVIASTHDVDPVKLAIAILD